MAHSLLSKINSESWNKGRIIGQKLPLKLKEIWAIRIRLQLAGEIRDLALFNLAIDKKCAPIHLGFWQYGFNTTYPP